MTVITKPIPLERMIDHFRSSASATRDHNGPKTDGVENEQRNQI